MKKILLSPQFIYFVRGKHPKLILHAGTHGNEIGSVEIVQNWIARYERLLPDFVFVPLVSPSAARLGTRKNEYEHDMNRKFTDTNSDPEVMWNRTVLDTLHAELMITFHEDTEYDCFYMYDVGGKPLPREKIQHFLNAVKRYVPLLNGIDDTSDPDLGFEFKDGYRFFKFNTEEQTTDNDMITEWCLRKGIVKRTLIVEIPGKAKPEVKAILVDIIMKTFATS